MSNTASQNISPAGHGIPDHLSRSSIPTFDTGTGSVTDQAASYHQTSVGNPDIHKESVEENIARMVGENEGTNVDDISPEERQRQEEIPRNPMKRMWEEETEQGKKDEL